VKHRLLDAAKLLCATTVLLFATQAMAEPLRLAQAQADVLPPYEIVTILRSTGLNPLDRPVRRGPNYVLRAVDGGGEEVRVVVDARGGEVLSVTPLATASRGPLPGPRPGTYLGPYEPMDPGYIPPGPPPPGVYGAGPPVVYEADEPVIYGVRPPAGVPGAPPPRQQAVTPPLTRSSPDIASAPLDEPHVIMAPDSAPGLLPPPPERFPQRAAPPPAKPVKRTAATTPKPVKPKVAPLPKPRPGDATATGSVPAATTPPQAKPSADPVPN